MDMSADSDKETACPTSEKQVKIDDTEDPCDDEICEKKRCKPQRKVCFPDDDHLVTQYFEPANPWQDVPPISRAQLAAEYLEHCRRHNTPPIDSVLQQIRELPESAIGGSTRAPRFSLCECSLLGCCVCDALEAVLCRAQFHRLELRDVHIDDDAAEALFDMIEYYESATVVAICGPRQFGIRGWQAVSRMIKKSAELSSIEISDMPLQASHAPVLSRALKPQSCRVYELCLTRTQLAGEPLRCLVIALRSNMSVRELRLGDNRLSPSDASQLATLLRLNHRIQMLDLSNNEIQDNGVAHIAEALVQQSELGSSDPSNSPVASPESKGLTVLVLWNNQLTRNCAHHLSRALRSSQSLVVLNIGRNPIGCESIKTMTKGSKLVCLGVQGTRLTGDSPQSVAQLITDSPCLQRLDLRDNKLGPAGLQAILDVVKERVTLTQIDLDDPVDSTTLSEDSESASVARLTREIRAACKRNEPTNTSAEYNKAHRKISLTCHTHIPKSMSCEEDGRMGKLRSPLPSPAGSPVPPPHANRFYVTRVTPPHSLSSDSSSASSTSPTVSRFTVVQVAEPPKIKVHTTTDQPRKSASRFSVTRNYDTMYNPTPVPSPPPDSTSPTPSLSLMDEINQTPVENRMKHIETPRINVETRLQEQEKTEFELKVCNSKVENASDGNNLGPTKIVRAPTPALGIGVIHTSESECSISPEPDHRGKNMNYLEADKFSKDKDSDVEDLIQVEEHHSKCPILKNTNIQSAGDVSKRLFVEENVNKDVSNVDRGRSESTLTSDPIPSQITPCPSACDRVNINLSSVIDESVKSDIVKSEQKYMDKSEQLSHNEDISDIGDGKLIKTETKITKNSTEMSGNEKVDVQLLLTVVTENVHRVNMQPAKVHSDQNNENIRLGSNLSCEKKDGAMKQIEAITEDLGNLIKEMQDLTTKTQVLTKKDVKFRHDCTQTEPVDKVIVSYNVVPANLNRDSLVLKKNKSESSLDSPDLEVSRLMNKKMVTSPFCDSSSSLEISGSSMESLNEQNTQITMKPIIIQESIESDTELDRRKIDHVTLSTESSMESNTSDIAPVHNSNFLNLSLSSNESVSPIIFGKNKKIHGSLSSLEASVSSLESAKLEKLMVTSADSGIEHSLQHPPENKDNTSNEGTLTNTSSVHDTSKKEGFQVQETLTSSPKRTHSLLDVPAKNKTQERTRKISWVAPSSSFHIPKPEPEKSEVKLTTHLEKLLSIFQHPASLFSKSQGDEEKKSNSNTPPRKDSTMTSSFWSWGSAIDKVDKEDREDSSENTDSTLSERVQVSFIDESFSRKLDSKTPSTDTDNTLSEFQSFPVQGNSEPSDASQDSGKKIDTVTEITTDDNLVQTCLDISLKCIDNASSNGNKDIPGACDIIDLMKPNDFNKNVYESPSGDRNKNPKTEAPTNGDSERKQEKSLDESKDDLKINEPVRPRSFASVLKSSGSENSLEKQTSPEGQPVAKLPSKVIRGIKENISPENTLTSSMTNTKTLAMELTDRQIKTHTVVNALWEVTLDKNEPKHDELKGQGDLAPIATIEETCDETADNSVHIPLEYIDDKSTFFDRNISFDSGLTLVGDTSREENIGTKTLINAELRTGLENIDLAKDALSYLIFENQSFDSTSHTDIKNVQSSLAEELKEAENKEKLSDLSPELVTDETELPDVFPPNESRVKTLIPERAKLKKSNSLEDITQRPTNTEKESKKIAFKMPEATGTIPRDIPEPRKRIRTRSGSSPKSLPESLNRPCPLSRMESVKSKKKKKVSSLGKIAKDSLLALNMSEDEIAEFRRSYVTSVESLRSLESVSEDANSQSGNSFDSRCRACLRTSQESLMSLDSINEDCKCGEECPRTSHSAR